MFRWTSYKHVESDLTSSDLHN